MLKLFRLIYFPLSIFITSIIMFPICVIRWRNYKNTSLFLKLYGFITTPVMGLKIRIFNRDILGKTKPAVVVGNHQHNFDILVASEVFRYKIISLGKKEIVYLPLFGPIFWLAGNLLVNRGNKEKAMKTMRQVEEYLRKNELGIVIFPEGHRNTKEELLPFKKGAFYTAVNCQIPIVPFVVSQYARNMNLNKFKAGKIYIDVLEPISTEGLTTDDIPMLMEKVREALTQAIKEINKKAGY